jgi:hypothetical protein
MQMKLKSNLTDFYLFLIINLNYFINLFLNAILLIKTINLDFYDEFQ